MIRSRAAPIGIRLIVSTGSLDGVGLSCSGVTIWSVSAFHAGIFCACPVSRIGAPAGVNGSFALPTPVVTPNDSELRP